jgi:hypothetical protein
VEKSRPDAARKALSQVRGKPIDNPEVNRELEDIIQDFQGHEKMSLLAQLKVTFSNGKVFYTFSMAVLLMTFQQWTGTNSINYYSPQIFAEVGLAGTSAGLFATGIYGVVKVVVTAIALCYMTEQAGRKWSLIAGGIGQAFAMFYIGINQAVNPVTPGAALNGNSIFAIISVYLFVVFYSCEYPSVLWGWLRGSANGLSSWLGPNSIRAICRMFCK